MNWHKDRFTISTDPKKLQLEAILAALAEQYWSHNRSPEIIRRSIQHSLCFGVYDNTAQIGLARVITDHATFAYICDVYILESHRGHGLGKWLMHTITTHPDLEGIRRFALVTKDAHGLYKGFGFTGLRQPERWMERLKENA
jgi:GNAT superfamily N-acetyltransferase